MDIDTAGRHASRGSLRYQTAILLGCTAITALAPTLLLGQDANGTGSDTSLAPIVLQGGGGPQGTLNTENDSKSVVATETTGVGKMPTDILTAPALDYNNFKSKNYGLYLPGAPPINWLDPVYSGGPSSTDPTYGTSNDQKTTGLYLQQDLTFFDRLTVSLGLRNDWLDLGETDLFTDARTADTHSEFSKRIGVSYKITDEFAAFASYGESVAPPAIGADPTTGKQYEVGVKYRPDAFPALFTASIFDLTKGNITTYDSVTYIPQTVDKVRHRGLEVEAKAEVTDNIDLIAAYTYIHSRIDEPGGANDGNRLMHVPKNMASVWGTLTLEGNGARGDMTFGLGARYVGSYFTDLANTQSAKSESAVLVDASFTYKIQENTTFQLNASNLFDEKHRVHQDSGGIFYNPGRTVMATLRQSW